MEQKNLKKAFQNKKVYTKSVLFLGYALINVTKEKLSYDQSLHLLNRALSLLLYAFIWRRKVHFKFND
ncbi:hypothetical protein pah_c047o025 [Parachlamydia acanthamoebae str. Hall's coccus]|nr:hypothetical protein pah_c047o025 [Parachlamydia acanthamoebae str. Hall's coccus]